MKNYARFKMISVLTLIFTLIFTAVQLVLPLFPEKCAAAGTASNSSVIGVAPAYTYCQMTGEEQGVITGGVKQTGRVGLMMVDSFSSENDSTFKITKQIDVASPKILLAYSNNEILTDVTLYIYKIAKYTSSSSEFIGYTIKLTNAQITGRRIYKETNDGNLPYEEITLKYELIQEKNNVTGDKLGTRSGIGVGTYCSIKANSGRPIQGTVAQMNYNGLMMLESFDLDFTEPTGQDNNGSDSGMTSPALTIVKELDRASPILQSAATNKDQLSEIVIDMYIPVIATAAGQPKEKNAYSIKLKNATITNRRIYKESGSKGDLCRAYEEISLTFESIEEIDPINGSSAAFDSNN